jgi:hypothetical protein
MGSGELYLKIQRRIRDGGRWGLYISSNRANYQVLRNTKKKYY